MKIVYTLRDDLIGNPKTVVQVQALTLDVTRPTMGLKGTHGLYGSQEWWENIYNGKIATRTVSGIIEKLVFASMDSRWGDEVNSFRLKLDDGSTVLESIYTNLKPDIKLFRVDVRVKIVYALLELKRQPARDGGVNYANTVLEMSVSTV